MPERGAPQAPEVTARSIRQTLPDGSKIGRNAELRKRPRHHRSSPQPSLCGSEVTNRASQGILPAEALANFGKVDAAVADLQWVLDNKDRFPIGPRRSVPRAYRR
jgi:hypothetical protein